MSTETAATEPVATVANAGYQLVSFEIVGQTLEVTVKTPSGKFYRGSVWNWRETTPVELPQ